MNSPYYPSDTLRMHISGKGYGMHVYHLPKKKSAPRPFDLIVCAVGCVLVVAGILALHEHRKSVHAYQTLSSQVHASFATQDTETIQTSHPSTGKSPDGSAINWQALWNINADAAAWVRVEGTSIDLPVLAPRDGDMTYYLSHDIWGEESLEGVPFLDHRCSADDAHRLVYGHHLTTGGQFSDLQRCFQQEYFESLGYCHWITPTSNDLVLEPLCALRIDMWYQPIQRFTFDNASSLTSWLETLASQASARARNWSSIVRDARSAVTLCTCASDISGQPWRTVVLFCERSTAG